MYVYTYIYIYIYFAFWSGKCTQLDTLQETLNLIFFSILQGSFTTDKNTQTGVNGERCRAGRRETLLVAKHHRAPSLEPRCNGLNMGQQSGNMGTQANKEQSETLGMRDHLWTDRA
jgi:hypothetical protein